MSEFHVTSAAAQRIAHLLKDEPALAMRVGVLGGGCSGFQYEFSFAKAREPDDIVFEAEGIEVLIDPLSMDLLNGATLDYVDELGGSYFRVTNPNATSGCGCGNSFSA